MASTPLRRTNNRSLEPAAASTNGTKPTLSAEMISNKVKIATPRATAKKTRRAKKVQARKKRAPTKKAGWYQVQDHLSLENHGVNLNEFFSPLNGGDVYNRDWMELHGISEDVLAGDPSRHHLPTLFTCGALRASDRLCVEFTSAGNSHWVKAEVSFLRQFFVGY